MKHEMEAGILQGCIEIRISINSGSLVGVPVTLVGMTLCWVAVKELKLSYYIEETLLFTIYTHYGNLI